MKIRSLLLASVVLSVSLNASDSMKFGMTALNASYQAAQAVGMCAAKKTFSGDFGMTPRVSVLGGVPVGATVVCDEVGECSFNVATSPVVVEEAVTQALETLVTDDQALMCNDTVFTRAFGVLQGALEYAQETGNDYLGEYIRDGLAMVQEQYEANPVATVLTGAMAVVATVYVLRGCARLMRQCFTACRRFTSRRHQVAGPTQLLVHVESPSDGDAKCGKGTPKKGALGVASGSEHDHRDGSDE